MFSTKGMSVAHVTNVMMSVLVDDMQNVEMYSEWLESECPRSAEGMDPGSGGLKLISGPDVRWGGWKQPECSVFGGVLNAADLDAVKQAFASIKWVHPNAVQLFLMDENEMYFRLWMIRNRELIQCAPLLPPETEEGFFGRFA